MFKKYFKRKKHIGNYMTVTIDIRFANRGQRTLFNSVFLSLLEKTKEGFESQDRSNKFKIKHEYH